MMTDIFFFSQKKEILKIHFIKCIKLDTIIKLNATFY